jgi:hypothetical protein
MVELQLGLGTVSCRDPVASAAAAQSPVSPRCVETLPWIRLRRATPGEMSTCALANTVKNPSKKTNSRKLGFMPT